MMIVGWGWGWGGREEGEDMLVGRDGVWVDVLMGGVNMGFWGTLLGRIRGQ